MSQKSTKICLFHIWIQVIFLNQIYLLEQAEKKRLSNFLLWEMAYTELYFTDVLWPDFKKDDLKKAIFDFSKRDRRYGNVIE